MVRAAQSLIKLRQSIFEPIYTHFKSANGYLSLTGSFYQSLLFISKCNVAANFIDAIAQQRVFDRINRRTRKLIDTLRYQEHFKSIGLSKFTDVCIELGLTSQLGGALRKLARHEILIPDNALVKLYKSVEKIDHKKSLVCALFHGEILESLRKNNMKKLLHEYMLKATGPIPTKHCGWMILSRYSQQVVFDVLNKDKRKESFDVYADIGLAELAMTIQASLKNKKTKKSMSRLAKRIKLEKVLKLARSKGLLKARSSSKVKSR